MNIEQAQKIFKKLTTEIREINTSNGWDVWQPNDISTHKYKFGSIIALITSEASEALEWYRQINKTGYILHDKIVTLDDLSGLLGWNVDHSKLEYISCSEEILSKIDEEMADIVIRVIDYMGGRPHVNLFDVINWKLAKNKLRGNRHGGKTI